MGVDTSQRPTCLGSPSTKGKLVTDAWICCRKFMVCASTIITTPTINFPQYNLEMESNIAHSGTTHLEHCRKKKARANLTTDKPHSLRARPAYSLNGSICVACSSFNVPSELKRIVSPCWSSFQDSATQCLDTLIVCVEQ